ncbi:MAG: alanyl-tRNA editing protein [Acidobacteriaceae bacterium]
MDAQLLYQEDQARLEFTVQVSERLTLPDGRIGIVLDRTYFYPTSGGQEHDTGLIGAARVVDVFKDEASHRLVHVVEGEVELGPITARIDAERRLRHMQHHTAQHLLTQCLLQVTGFDTVSANIKGYTPSTLDITATQVGKSELDQAELLANQIIYENRLVKTYNVTPEELTSIPLRRPPKVSENIRIVEIDAFDFSPCGGTHVSRTGSIGLVKVLKAERLNDRLRVYFIAGWQAMQMFQQMHDSLTATAGQLSMSWQGIPELVSKQAEQLAALQKDLQVLRSQSARYEALELAANSEPRGQIRLSRAIFERRPVVELRMLAEQLKNMPGLVAFLASFDGQKVSLLVTCGENTGQDARQLLIKQLSQLNGRGGGDAHLAQGGGPATEEQYQQLRRQLDL